MPEVIEVLKDLKPSHVTERDYVFLNQEGEPLTSTPGEAVSGTGFYVLRVYVREGPIAAGIHQHRVKQRGKWLAE